MLNPETGGEEQFSPPISLDPLAVVGTPEMARLQIEQSLKRNLPTLQMCKPHKLKMSIVAGGPSAEDTISEMDGYVAAVNKAHDWLWEKGRRVHACGVVDPVPWMANYITPNKVTTYFLASQCHPLVFDKLKDSKVVLWHAGTGERIPILDLLPPGDFTVPGGTSMALRWIDLGYVLGFRSFDMHGFDCSHRAGRHHVYEFKQDDGLPTQEVMGYPTWPGWLAQVNDFFLRMEFLRHSEMDPIQMTLHGDGLLQHLVKQKHGTNTFWTKSSPPPSPADS